jgi:hypothetical protein
MAFSAQSSGRLWSPVKEPADTLVFAECWFGARMIVMRDKSHKITANHLKHMMTGPAYTLTPLSLTRHVAPESGLSTAARR